MIRSSRALAAAGLVAAAWMTCPGPAMAARTPAWAEQIVEEAPEPPEGVGPHSQRVLFEETREEVQKDGTVRVTYLYAAQALTSRASEVGIGSFFFDDSRRMIANKAWHIAPGKGAKRNRQPPVDIAVGSEFLTDDKVRAIGVSGVEKGSIVLFEFAAIETPYWLPRAHVFGSRFPALRQRYAVVLPEGWNLEWDWLRFEGPDPVVAGGVYTWELTGREAALEEPLGPSILEQSPGLVVNLLPPEGAATKPAVLPSWQAFSSWYEGIGEDRHLPGPEVARVAESLMSDAGDGVLSAIGSAGRYVRDKVRYVAVGLGIGAFQPRPAGETLVKLYGDCKDKGVLFRSVLDTEKVSSHAVLVHLSERDTLSETIPAWGFSHYVVAVPLPADEAIPEAYAPATLDAGEMGRFLIVDTTDDRISIGHISGSLSGKRALLVAGDAGGLVTLPGMDSAAHRVTRRVTGQLTPEGVLVVERRTLYHGEFAGRVRESYRRSSVDRRKEIEAAIMDIWPDARIESYEAEEETAEGDFAEMVGGRVHLKRGGDGVRRVPLFPGVREDLARVSLGKREVAVVYEVPRTIRYEVEVTGLPEGSGAPETIEASGGGWTVKGSSTLEGGRLAAAIDIVLAKTRFEPAEFEELRGLWTAINRAASATLKIPG